MVSAEGTHDRARDHRAEMDVVTISLIAPAPLDRQAVAKRIGVPAERHQRPPFSRAAGGNPGANQIGGVQPHVRTSAPFGLMGGDEGAELFEGRHRLPHFIVSGARVAALVLVGDLA